MVFYGVFVCFRVFLFAFVVFVDILLLLFVFFFWGVFVKYFWAIRGALLAVLWALKRSKFF